ncbi:ribosome biogenesis GTP-binding protein YihA/YsxC [Mesomycoplasma bovoculi]|uniref:Probable GTP-binding protein EngB n=1 Tax=Mesomycoplasma bovoculi M165/69 TaxID=743966 RepID=W5UT14_9BACT|nr:ribosome biogenesis GTP-binding protein YihA/YsxC [Mesomycoplasma bovoculi]AHH45266.1 ribosome biogenesis GTP-binding protein YsxC (EngB) [Mesomycoplasma bovoculi M165/69]
MWKFIKSAASKNSWYQTSLEQFAFIGRSNVGKSSLINALANCKIARVSKQPGRTQLINYFQVKDKIVIDLPGYGYARLSIAQKSRISLMLADFFRNAQLSGIFLIIDATIGFQELDYQMLEYLIGLGHKVIVIANKVDKTNQSQKAKIANQAKKLNLAIVFVSAKNKVQLDAIRSIINY